jgi:signal transduction histidine kinase
LSDAMRYSTDIVGVSRFNRKGEVVVKVGQELPESLGPATLSAQGETQSSSPLIVATPTFWGLITAIHGRGGTRIGTDFVIFRTSDLEQALGYNTDDLRRMSKTVLAATDRDRMTPIFPLHDPENIPTASSALGLALKRAALKQTGLLFPGKDHTGNEVVAYGPVPGTPWVMAQKMHSKELYASVYPHVISASAVIGILILAGTFGMIFLVRPLTGKMVIHADELDQQVQEKVKIIDDLYEHIVQSEKSKAVAEHTAEVAHELRQPLAIVGGFARRMKKHFDSGGTFEVEQKESCGIIISEIQRLEKILGDLIDFTKRPSVRMEKVQPNDVIQNVINVYAGKLTERDLKLKSNLSGELGGVVLDPHRFEQVVRNLLSNAVEASPVGASICIQTRDFMPGDRAREIGELESKSYFEMIIHNYGPIIPPEHLQKIFSPFFTTKDGGNGLGLSVSKKIVEDHNGSISVKSDEEGTVFTVWLPIEREPLERSTEK